LGRAGQQVDCHTVCGVDVINPRIPVAGDAVVATETFKFVEGKLDATNNDEAAAAGIGARRGKSSGVVSIDEIGGTHRLDRTQRVGADRSITDHRAGRHVDGYSAGDVVVGAEPVRHTVETPTAVDEIVSAAALEHLHSGEIVAAMEDVGEL
jgi:hypothetical protein